MYWDALLATHNLRKGNYNLEIDVVKGKEF